MTILGDYFTKKCINKASISRLTGITESRLSRLSRDSKSKLTAEELFLLSKAITIDPIDLLNELYADVKLQEI